MPGGQGIRPVRFAFPYSFAIYRHCHVAPGTARAAYALAHGYTIELLVYFSSFSSNADLRCNRVGRDSNRGTR